MMNRDTENTAKTLVADGKGILAADETPGTLTRRFDALGIRSTEQSRRNVMRYTTTDMHNLPGSSPGDRRT